MLVLIYTPISVRFLSGILAGGMFGAVSFAAGAGDLTGICWQSMNSEIKHEKVSKNGIQTCFFRYCSILLCEFTNTVFVI